MYKPIDGRPSSGHFSRVSSFHVNMQRHLTITVPDYLLEELTLQAPSSRRPRLRRASRTEPVDADQQLDELWHEAAGYLFTVAASNKAMQGLRAPAVGDTRELACAVCLDDFEASDELRTMPCTHSFHELCIFRWLRISHLCPCCRFPLPSVDEQWVLDRDEQAAQACSATGSEATDDD
ncbi:zinc c3hc4 type family expressed [Hordeum vulgare]|nr:zinc c3hc4 type family expressed [Hordeum vulgare]